MALKNYCLAVLLFVAVLQTAAQRSPYPFKHVTVNNGLSHNEVLCFLKDKRGFLWIGTTSGLNRYDGYSIKVFLHNSRDSSSIGNNNIQKLFETPDGKIGVMTSEGLNLYEPESETFTRNLSDHYQRFAISDSLSNSFRDQQGNYWMVNGSEGAVYYDAGAKRLIALRHSNNDSTQITTDSVSWFTSTHDSHWIVHTNGILEKIELTAGSYRVAYRDNFLFTNNNGRLLDYRMVADRDGDLWIFTANDNQGVYYFQERTNKFVHIHKDSRDMRLNTNIVRGVVIDNSGLAWIGTDHGGINVINKKKGTVNYVLHRDEDNESIGQNTINALYKDAEGIIWTGTYKKGVSYFHENILRFPIYEHSPSDVTSLPYSDVNRFVEDDDGNLWIGTNGGGLIMFNRAAGTFKQYRHDPKDPTSLSADVIVSLFIDHQRTLWVGTYYGGLNRFDGKKFIRFIPDKKNAGSIADQSVWEIFEDSERRLWIGTLNGGLDQFDRRTNSFVHYRSTDPSSIQSDYIAAITEDKERNLWIGTTDGIDVLLRSSGRFIHFESDPSNAESLSNNNVFDIHEDSYGRIWVATSGGLNLYNKKTRTFRTFTTEDGLPHNSVLTILEDKPENLWMSTPNGLAHLILETKGEEIIHFKFRVYGEADGLQGKQFNENAAYRTSKGELLFGGADGFNIFKPSQLGLNQVLPPVVFTDFLLTDKSIHANQEIGGEVILPSSISESTSITIPADRNVFTIEFAALNFLHPENNQYKYRLEGFDANWISADASSRKVTFTNLDPGDYTFHVIASNNDDLWNETGAKLVISVLPPFWKTTTAMVLYFLVIIAALFVTRKLIQQREKLKFAIEHERQEAMRMHELDMMKIRFFTNVSHEFRTPLTLILTPLEKILKQASEPEQKTQFQLIQRNAKRLLNLVNQLLDFRKLEVQEVTVNPAEGDIVQFIRDAVYSFSDLSEKKDIKLDFQSSVNSLETLFDQDKLEKILFNLLSNAFKFTSEHGAVSVVVDQFTTHETTLRNWLRIKVIDTGIGIAADKQERIFDRFFQSDVPRSLVNQGSGIGLAITKEFVRLQGGTISVESELGKGSTFVVCIPIERIAQRAAADVEVPSMAETTSETDLRAVVFDETEQRKPVLLLVEDNEDFRFYLKDNLKLTYRIIEAKNGREGWKKALDNLPDMIVSDVMMPEMDGIQLCRKIKTDGRVSHVPVILLTARASEEQKIEGFQTGADDYITKPFNFEILVSRIHNLIVQRVKFHKTIGKQIDVRASELNITPLDEKFIQNAVKCVEDNVSNPDFSVEHLGRELGISRAHMYKKIVALTGKSPLEFIRTIRLQQAAQLLEKSQLTVAEVAYKVGFNNPKYFARYFKEEYNMLPSLYAAGKRKGA
jgi:signal transduction histidine kinase/ligand-binding sensor domain-containing protein/DNA-binding response OmpR family regulator